MEYQTFSGKTVDKAINIGLVSLGLKSKDEADIQVVDQGKKGFLGFGSRPAKVMMSVKLSVEDILNDSIFNLEIQEPEPEPEFEKEDLTSFEQEPELEVVEEKTEIETEFIEEPVENQEHPAIVVEDHDEEDYLGDLSAKESRRLLALEDIAAYIENIANLYGSETIVYVEDYNRRVYFDLETDKEGLIIGKHGKTLNALQSLAQNYASRVLPGRITITLNVGNYRHRREETLRQIADQTAEEVVRKRQAVFLDPMPAFERKIVHAQLSRKANIATHSEGREPHRYLVVDYED